MRIDCGHGAAMRAGPTCSGTRGDEPRKCAEEHASRDHGRIPASAACAAESSHAELMIMGRAVAAVGSVNHGVPDRCRYHTQRGTDHSAAAACAGVDARKALAV